MNLVDIVNQDHINPNVANFPKFRPGDNLIVHVRISEGSGADKKSRIQLFQGTCIAVRRHGSMQGHFKVRKMAFGIGVERTFPFHSPSVDKVELLEKGKSRRAKHYFLRELSGKAARIEIDYDRKE